MRNRVSFLDDVVESLLQHTRGKEIKTRPRKERNMIPYWIGFLTQTTLTEIPIAHHTPTAASYTIGHARGIPLFVFKTNPKKS